MVVLYATPTVPFGKFVVLSASGAGFTVKVTGPVPVLGGFEASVPLTVTVALLGAVGVPVTLQPLSVRPAGKVPEVNVQVYGPLPPLTGIVAA